MMTGQEMREGEEWQITMLNAEQQRALIIPKLVEQVAALTDEVKKLRKRLDEVD